MKTSIIIPTYNRAHLLSRAVKSIHPGFPAEIIIADDGSVDNTKKVVAELQKKDPRIVFVPLPENKGVNYARNKGIESATSEWVQFLDSDDEYVTGGFEAIDKSLEDVPSDIDVVGFMTLRETGGIMEPRGFCVGEQWTTYEPSYQDVLFKEHIQGDIHYCIRRSIFAQEGYRFADYINGFETAFFAKLAKDGKKFLYINQVVDMRHNEGGTHLSTEPYKRWPRQFARAYRELVDEHYEIFFTRPDALRHFYMRTGKCMLRSGNPLGIWWFMKGFGLKFNKENIG